MKQDPARKAAERIYFGISKFVDQTVLEELHERDRNIEAIAKVIRDAFKGPQVRNPTPGR